MLAQLRKCIAGPSQGLTLVELMVVIAVLGIVLAVAIPSFGDMLARKRVQLIASELASDLAYARTEAGLKSVGVYTYFQKNTEMSCYLLAQRTVGVGNCDCTRAVGTVCQGVLGSREIKTIQILKSTGVAIKVLRPEVIVNGVTGLKFIPPRLEPAPLDLAVLVESSRGSQPKLQIELNAMGRVKICCPDGSFNGVQPCV